jgi:hypothetical protein
MKVIRIRIIFSQSCAEFERQEKEPVITVNHTEMAHEDNLEDEEIEGTTFRCNANGF